MPTESDVFELVRLAKELIEALPKCDNCEAPATRADGRGGPRKCDKHGYGLPVYPRAHPLKVLQEKIAEIENRTVHMDR